MNNALTYRIAVYGSLKHGFGNHGLLGTARFVGTTRLMGLALYDLGPFPGVRYDDNASVEVELYDVDDATLAAVDRLEGCRMGYPDGSFYYRHRHDSDFGHVWVYIYQPAVEPEAMIASGVW